MIDDDVELCESSRLWFEERDIFEHVQNGRDAIDRLATCEYDVVVVDINLPDMTGVEIVRSYRNNHGRTPMLVLSAETDLPLKEQALDSGADDYLTKPFSFRELAARIRALIRRSNPNPETLLRVNDLVLDPVKHTVTKNGTEIDLQRKEFALLEFFMRYPDQPFTADALLSRVWHSESEVTPDIVKVYVNKLRTKIDTEGEPSYFETIRRLGYKLATKRS